MRYSMVLAAVLAGCSLYSEGDDEPVAVDASPGLSCESSADRNVSCRNICRADIELCPGVADWTICLDECRTGVAVVAWCPGMAVR